MNLSEYLQSEHFVSGLKSPLTLSHTERLKLFKFKRLTIEADAAKIVEKQ